jgi:membrane associated rhomboid family serine protease
MRSIIKAKKLKIFLLMANSNYGNSLQRTTPVVLNLIIINVLVFVAQLIFKGIGLTEILALYPFDSGFFKPYQLITHMFTHSPDNFFHILLNMYALWMFGSVLEKVWGAKRFLIFYLTCGLAAGITQMFLVQNAPAIGASGAIMGLLAAFAYLFPNTQFFIIPFPFPIKAKYMVVIIAAIDLFGGIHSGDDVAHFAHLGGLVMGFILVLIWNKTDKKTFY